MRELMQKQAGLSRILRGCGSAAVAFSGGVDSTFLLWAAMDALNGNVTAITVRSPFFPDREAEEAAAFCAEHGIRQIILDVDVLDVPEIRDNPADRCYHCKKALFRKITEAADQAGAGVVMEGSNLDDDADYRPGRRAIRELGIRGPLREAGLSKDEIRTLSEELGLPTWNKPAFACLASRIPYGEILTCEKLRMVEAAEDLLLGLGFTQLRVRAHESVSGQIAARIELPAGDIPRMFMEQEGEGSMGSMVSRRLKELGFSFVSLDLEGYRMGSLNQELPAEVVARERVSSADERVE